MSYEVIEQDIPGNLSGIPVINGNKKWKQGGSNS